MRPWFGRGTSNLARECDCRGGSELYARGWRTCVPSEPRTHVRGHLFLARRALPRQPRNSRISARASRPWARLVSSQADRYTTGNRRRPRRMRIVDSPPTRKPKHWRRCRQDQSEHTARAIVVPSHECTVFGPQFGEHFREKLRPVEPHAGCREVVVDFQNLVVIGMQEPRVLVRPLRHRRAVRSFGKHLPRFGSEQTLAKIKGVSRVSKPTRKSPAIPRGRTCKNRRIDRDRAVFREVTDVGNRIEQQLLA